MPICDDLKIKDDLKDLIGLTLQEMNKIKTWTQKKHNLYKQFLFLSQKMNYKEFSSNLRVYGISCMGNHYILIVPKNQRGALAQFRGRRVRLVCIGGGGGFGDRNYCVGLVENRIEEISSPLKNPRTRHEH